MTRGADEVSRSHCQTLIGKTDCKRMTHIAISQHTSRTSRDAVGS